MIEIMVPTALLLDRELTSSAKLVWMLCRLHTGDSPPPASRLAAQSGLTPTTVRTALGQVTVMPLPEGPTAIFPVSLLTDPKLPPVAKVLYGVLQTQNGEFTYPALSLRTGTGPNTLKRAMAALVEAEWLQAQQRNRLAPVRFSLCDPFLARQQSEIERARRRLLGPDKGERIMKEFLSLLVDSREYEDNARPGFLINPRTGVPLELDRYYINIAAFEYNGAPHFGTSALAKEQQTRDMVKVGICALRHIPVVVVHSEDLTLVGMRAKIGNLLPLRDVTGHEPLIEFLERRARRYRAGGEP